MKPFFVKGTSMWPILKPGDLVFTAEKKYFDVGDLVVRPIAGEMTVHRYLAPGKTKGDWVGSFDESTGLGAGGLIVIGIATPGGSSKIAGPRVRVLTSLHGIFSSRLAGASTRLERVFLRLALLANGFIIRWFYYYGHWENLDVVHGS